MSRVFFTDASVAAGRPVVRANGGPRRYPPVGECRPDGSGEYQIRHHFLAPRLWAEEKSEAPTAAADNAADQHRNREPKLVVQRKIGDDGRHETAENRPQVIAEGARRRPHLGWKPLGHVGRHVSAGAAAEQGPLRDVADNDYPIVAAEHVSEGDRYAQQAGNDHGPAAADTVTRPAPEHACQEDAVLSA